MKCSYLFLTALFIFSARAQVYGSLYELQNLYSGKALDDAGWSIDNGSQVDQWDFANGGNQQWRLIPLPNGAYEIQNEYSGKALEDTGWSTSNGTPVGQWDWANGTNQQWWLISLSNGAYEIQNVYSGKVLDDTGWSTSNGTLLDQWDWGNAANQQWYINYAAPGDGIQPQSCTQTETANSSWINDIIYGKPSSTICFQPGVYSLGATITIPNGVSVAGVGNDPSAVIFQVQTGLSGNCRDCTPVFQTAAGGNGSTLSNFTIFGYGNPYNTPNVTGVWLENTSNTTLENVIIQSISGDAIVVNNDSSYIYISKTQIGDVGGQSPRQAVGAVYVSNSGNNNFWIHDNVFTGHDSGGGYIQNADGGIGFYGAASVNIYNNTIRNAGIYFAQATNNVNAWGNSFYYTQEWPFDIVDGSYNINVASNSAQGAGFGAVAIGNNSTATPYNVSITYNTFTNGNRWGYAACGGINLAQYPTPAGNAAPEPTNNNVTPSPESCPAY